MKTHFFAWYARNFSLFRIASYLAKGYKLLKAYGKLTTGVRCFAKWISEWEQSVFFCSRRKTQKTLPFQKGCIGHLWRTVTTVGSAMVNRDSKPSARGNFCRGDVFPQGGLIVVSTCWGFSRSPLMIRVIGADEVHFLIFTKEAFLKSIYIIYIYIIVAFWLLSWWDNVISIYWPGTEDTLRYCFTTNGSLWWTCAWTMDLSAV